MDTQTKYMIGGAVVLAMGAYWYFYVRTPTPVTKQPATVGPGQNAGTLQGGTQNAGTLQGGQTGQGGQSGQGGQTGQQPAFNFAATVMAAPSWMQSQQQTNNPPPN